jgi:putative salt-induced outer membrane protein
MNGLLRCAFGAVLAVSALHSAAAQAPPPKARELTADLGFVNTAGNTDVTTLNIGEKLILRAGKWEHKQQAGSVYGAQDGEQTSNLLFANWRSDYSLNSWLAVFGYGGYDRNTFAGISRRSEETLGLAAKLLTRQSDVLVLEAGPGLTQQRSTLGESNSFAALRTGTSYRHNFTAASYFTQVVEYLPSLEVGEDYRINSETALVAPLSSHAAIKVGYQVRYDNLPEPLRKKGDRIFLTSLQFNW